MIPPGDIIAYLVSAGGAYAWFSASRLRRAAQKKTELEVDSGWRQFYKDLLSDMKGEIEAMKKEIFMLRQVVEGYKESCDGCPNNIKK